MKQDIRLLLDQQYVTGFFIENILPAYPSFKAIKKIKINPRKDGIVDDYYHIVIEYITTFLDKKGKKRKLLIYCTAHSSEPRKKVFDNLQFLWNHKFGYGDLSIPKPLLYVEKYNATFYRGATGHNLLHYIRNNDRAKIEAILVKAAKWFARLHQIPADDISKTHLESSRIKTVVPGAKKILELIGQRYPEELSAYKEIYQELIRREENSLAGLDKRWIVHGDAHPENVIRMSRKKICVIDFTDLCLTDFARDLGSFTQQLDFMIRKNFTDKLYAEKAKQIFLDNYFKITKFKFDEKLKDRIKTYYCWTEIRTATYFLLKHNPKPHRSEPMLKQAKKLLELK